MNFVRRYLLQQLKKRLLVRELTFNIFYRN